VVKCVADLYGRITVSETRHPDLCRRVRSDDPKALAAEATTAALLLDDHHVTPPQT